MNEPRRETGKGPLAWMTRNSVAANLAMLFLIVGGLIASSRVRQEVFPEVDLGLVTVAVPYPGANPEQVEEGVLLPLEEAVRGVDAVKTIRSQAREGSGTVVAELFLGADPDRALDDIQSAVNRLASLPQNAERPVISLQTTREEVLTLVLYGDRSPSALREAAERIRDDMLSRGDIAAVDILGLPQPEVAVEIPQENLRRYGLTLEEVAQAVAEGSVELPGGTLQTPGGEVAIRTGERSLAPERLRGIVVRQAAEGGRVTVADLGRVVDTLQETDREAYYQGRRAVLLRVFQIGEQTPLAVAESARDFIEERKGTLPPDLHLEVLSDFSRIYADRIGLLVQNGIMGLGLVLLLLSVFLHLRLAFWVTLGMAASFLGAFLFMPFLDVSINMISLFGFLLVLGIVVDDAIVVGEAAYKHRSEGAPPLEAALGGLREVIQPVTFAVLTTIIAFLPMLFIPGVAGEFFRNIPLIVIPILAISLFESIFILPAHLAHHGFAERAAAQREAAPARGIRARAGRLQRGLTERIDRFIDERFGPFTERVLEYRGTAMAAGLGILIVTIGFFAGGRIGFVFFPRIEADMVSATVELPAGAPLEETRRAAERVAAGAREVLAGLEGEASPAEGLFLDLGRAGVGEQGESAPHLAMVTVYLKPAEERDLSSSGFASRWRAEVGEIPGVRRLAFESSLGPGAGPDVDVELYHRDPQVLEAAAESLAAVLSGYAGVYDVDPGVTQGISELVLDLQPQARALGLTEGGLARQVRSAFFGTEAFREQRGREEVRVMARLPLEQRRSEYHLRNLVIRTPAGGEIPLGQAAEVETGNTFTVIERRQGRRIADVTAEADPAVVSGRRVSAELLEDVLPDFAEAFPGLGFGPGGEFIEQSEALASLWSGLGVALLGMFALMAIALRSYSQPAIILSVIPFGFVGALIGHLLLGYDLSLPSVLGMLALAGVVVNDSLVLVSAIDGFRSGGMSLRDAIVAGAKRRFRPVWLTSLTTFFGLTPMIFATSLQARFLIPMALSLGFGVLFVTFVTLLWVPAVYLTLALWQEKWRGWRERREREKAAGVHAE